MRNLILILLCVFRKGGTSIPLPRRFNSLNKERQTVVRDYVAAIKHQDTAHPYLSMSNTDRTMVNFFDAYDCGFVDNCNRLTERGETFLREGG